MTTPTHHLTVFNEKTKETGEIGAAWENTDGSFSIRLNCSVVLSERAGSLRCGLAS